MVETISPQTINFNERSCLSNIFDISQQTDTIIACIQGVYSSPKITNLLRLQGYNNFSCLSGGIAGLSDFFHDTETSSDISYYFHHDFNNSVRKTIFEQTKNSNCDYYRKLEGKALYVVTHKVFINLDHTITGQSLYQHGVKEIKYFQEEKDLKNFFINRNILPK